ncbi:MAG: glycosyltransferase family 4 protein [Pseudomonadota bacterium]|nr:glycosyltransferase family 4 protein [Pseudomonadota bacterium]
MKAPVIMQILPRLDTGGVERGTVDVAAALVAAGKCSIVVSSGGKMVREVERVGALHITVPVDSKNPIMMLKNANTLADLILTYGVDIVHARSRAPAWSARLSANRCKIPFMTTFHGTYNFNNPLKKKYNAIMTKGDRVIAISDFIRQHVCENYNTPHEKIRVISRGIDLDIFNPSVVSAERIVQLANSWRLNDHSPVIMLPGRLTRWKGQSILIEAARILSRPGVRVLLVGDDQGRTRYRRELENRIRKNGMEKIIHITGPCRDMAAAYMLADVVVSPSTDPEAFGRVAAEALAMGRLVVASDHGGARETVEDGKTGWLVPPGDPNALARALNRALDMTNEDRRKHSQIAIKRIQENFAKQKMCSATLAVYDELLHVE